jgi:cytochrome c oxidase subunit 2
MFSKPFFGTLPVVGSDIAYHWDLFYYFLVAISAVFFAIVMVGMIYFTIRYRKGAGGKTNPIEGHTGLEIFWTAIPTVLVIIIFIWGYLVYVEMDTPPGDSYPVRVIGKKWSWSFLYENGAVTSDLYVPLNKPVKLIMTSEDVLHSFFIPAFRVKKDVVPGRYTELWFEAKVPGDHQVFCAEYCGAAHSGMLAKVKVLSADLWQSFLRGEDVELALLRKDMDTLDHPQVEPITLADQGKKLLNAKGCVSCHSIDGSVKLGPSFRGIYGKEVALSNGTTVIADENYIRESIFEPRAQIVQGYEHIPMPTFKGQMTELEMSAIITYLKTLN